MNTIGTSDKQVITTSEFELPFPARSLEALMLLQEGKNPMKAHYSAVRSGAEALYYTKTVNCPICGKITEFTFLYLVVETWRNFRN